jgi:hypothetical protein
MLIEELVYFEKNRDNSQEVRKAAFKKRCLSWIWWFTGL